MEKIINTLKWGLAGQIIGSICILVSHYVPVDTNINNALFIFGIVLILGYVALDFVNVFKPLKEKE